jgi:flavin reductase (DIM6/NTAB) family NADH-FMN oxidoreductase RutF
VTQDATFEALVGELDYPMFLVTAAAGGERAGCLVGFTTQTSIDPSRFLVCLSRQNRTYRVARGADVLVVHWLPSDEHELAELFGGETGDEVDKFERCAWRPGPDGVPVLTDLDRWFAGRIEQRVPLGDHVGHLLAPIEGEAGTGAPPLRSRQAQRIEPGHGA